MMSPADNCSECEFLLHWLCASLSPTKHSLFHLSKNLLIVVLRCLACLVRTSGVTSNSSDFWQEYPGAFISLCPTIRCEGVGGSSKSSVNKYDIRRELRTISTSVVEVRSLLCEDLACLMIFLKHHLVYLTCH